MNGPQQLDSVSSQPINKEGILATEPNRRDAIRQSALGLSAIFCVGALEIDNDQLSTNDEILLAAATTFEVAIQKLLIPYGCSNGSLNVPRRVAAEIKEMSMLLDPTTGPPVFENVDVFSRAGEIVVRFGPAVCVAINPRSIEMLRHFLAAHPDFQGDPNEWPDKAVIEIVLSPFQNGTAFEYD
ncbi:MAG: hypothetical protein HKN47_19800 [Pirellulaceae bacterium]|nr:hypothetical protein [Pirellulaceae bacterium]